MHILATLTIRNEAAYLKKCLSYHLGQGIEIMVIDNGSTDESLQICESFLGKGVIGIEQLAYPGYFDLTAILLKEAEVQRNSGADWLIHLDADEILQSNKASETLAEAIGRIDAKGCNAINFEEFVFLPEDSTADYAGRDYLEEMRYYYCHRPGSRRLVRAFKNGIGASNLESGGHRLEGGKVKMYRKSFFLRHYIGLSERHLQQKYGNRIFSPTDLAKGWSKNRAGLTESDIQLPPVEKLEKYPFSAKKPFRTRKAYKKHFWEWDF